jgi:peptidoglycan/LPS O-acetylase OafA/YrhL
LYWFFTGLMALALFLFPEVTRSESFDASRFVASLFFVSAPLGYPFPTLGVGWTLEYEFLFYAFITLGLACGMRGKLLPFAGVLFTGLFLVGLGSTMLFEFLFGMLAAALTNRAWSGAGSGWLLTLGLALAIASIPLTGTGWDRALIYGVPSFLIVIALAVRPQTRAGLLTLLGDASFSIYLTHQPILSALGKGLQRFAPEINGDLAVALSVALLVAIGAATYLLLERPVIRWLKRRLRKPRPTEKTQAA